MRGYNIFGLIALSLFIISTALKHYHLPGAAFGFILSMFLMIGFVAPMRLMAMFKTERSKVFTVIEYVTLTALSVAFVFKVQHWPFGGLMLFLFNFLFLLVYVPAYIVSSYRARSERNALYFNLIIGGIVVLMFNLYMGGQVSRGLLDSYDLALMKQQELFQKSELKTEKLLESIRKLNNDSVSIRSERLHNATSGLVGSIDTLINFLVATTEGITMEQADSLWIGNIKGRDNFDIPTTLLINQGRGKTLHTALDQHSELVKSLFDSSLVLTIEDELTIDTKDRFDTWRNVPLSWEEHSFDHVPLSVTIGSLLTLRHEIIQIENAALEHLIDIAAANNPENFAAIIAEINSRYEAEARENQISQLSQQKKLADESVKTKQQELEAVSTTLIWLILGILVFIIMLVFVIRSNIARKRLNKEITAQKVEIEHQKELVDEKNREITDSITYAKRIQEAILPPQKLVREYLANSFVLYKPKDIVAGDFYWMQPIGGWVFFAAADCTGHGVPGAMVSVICNNGLNRSVREFGLREPSEILNKTRELVLQEFEKSEEEVKDGMDISLCALNTKTNELLWAGANNPLWIVRNGATEVEEVKADKQPIGKFGQAKPFTGHSLTLNAGDTIYIFSDGYPDQFGGENGKKYKSGKFKQTLVELASHPMNEQLEKLDQEFESWRGTIEQIDDVCVIGVKV